MNVSISKLIIALVAIALCLVVLNFILVSNVKDGKRSHSNASILQLFSHTSMRFGDLDIDAHGEYRIQTNFIKATTRPIRGAQDVVMVTHCTVNHLHYLINMVEHWQGHISVAVMVPGLDIITAYKAAIGLHLCNKKIKQRVSFHMVYPLSHPSFVENLKTYVKDARKSLPKSCSEFFLNLNSGSTGKTNYGNVEIPYPNNLLRNVARRATTAEYFFMVDIDMMCSSDLYQKFISFAEENNLFDNDKEKKVYVVPAFESDKEIPMETSKESLIKLWDAGKVQPFYYNACRKCQRPTNYEKWRSHTSNSDKLEVSHTVSWIDPWEPFYIGSRDVPYYDERFKKYGFNRISQVCEMHVAGFIFDILDNAFLVHHGLKTNFHKKKDEENDKNRELFRKFKRELKTKYPDSQRRC